MNIKFQSSLLAVLIIATAWRFSTPNEELNYTLKDGSVVEWKGTMENGANNGSFSISKHRIEVKNGRLIRGSFTIPIVSIRNFNLQDSTVREQLLHHLKSPDFFNIAIYPEAEFSITKVTPAKEGANARIGANHLITGSLTMLGKTNSITFPANIGLNEQKITIKAKFLIDRTRWGMTYASDPKEKLFIHKDVELSLQLEGSRGK